MIVVVVATKKERMKEGKHLIRRLFQKYLVVLFYYIKLSMKKKNDDEFDSILSFFVFCLLNFLAKTKANCK